MAKPEITITLGRYRQKVVKDSSGSSDVIRLNSSVPSVTKRSNWEYFWSSDDQTFNHNKRMRNDVHAMVNAYSNHLDVNGATDLRLKLTRKRLSREVEVENELRKKIEQHEASKAICSSLPPDDKLMRSAPFLREAVEKPKVGFISTPFKSSYSLGAVTRSHEMIPRSCNGTPTARSAIDELPQLSSLRAINDALKDGSSISNPMGSSKPNVPMPTAPRYIMNNFRPAAGGMSIPYFQAGHVTKQIQPLTVSSLLHSLGLGKYYINFQAEEIDMAALRQMGEGDLKELGIPMGPRKKIFLAVQGLARRPVRTLLYH